MTERDVSGRRLGSWKADENIACKRCGRKTLPLFPNYVCIDCATSAELEKYSEAVTE
jgi:DNA-directed RNA polymerase subunit RPC12/RpoP